MSLKIQTVGSEQGVLTLSLEGRLDSETAPSLDAELSTRLVPEVRTLVLDLAQLEYVSSAGLRSLFSARVAMSEQQGSLFLVCPQPAVRRVLDLVRIVEPQSVLDSAEELDALMV